MMKYAFYNDSGEVVQCFIANITTDQLNQFKSDYSILFNAVGVFICDQSNPVWIGWKIVDGLPVDPSTIIIND